MTNENDLQAPLVGSGDDASQPSLPNFASVNPDDAPVVPPTNDFDVLKAILVGLRSIPAVANDTINKPLVDLLHLHKEMLIPTIISAAGDIPWVYFSYRNWNVALNTTPSPTFEHFFDANGQVAAQVLYPTCAMIFAALCLKMMYHAAGRSADFPATLAASTVISTGLGGIPAFEAAGIAITQNITWHPGYLSSLSSGPAEGLGLMLINRMMLLLLSGEEWDEFTHNNTEYLKKRFAELRLSATVGGIPGIVWQVLYNVGATTEALSPFPGVMSLVISLAVAVCNGCYLKCLPAMIEGLRNVDAGIANLVAATAKSTVEAVQKAGLTVAGFFSASGESSNNLPDPFQNVI